MIMTRKLTPAVLNQRVFLAGPSTRCFPQPRADTALHLILLPAIAAAADTAATQSGPWGAARSMTTFRLKAWPLGRGTGRHKHRPGRNSRRLGLRHRAVQSLGRSGLLTLAVTDLSELVGFARFGQARWVRRERIGRSRHRVAFLSDDGAKGKTDHSCRRTQVLMWLRCVYVSEGVANRVVIAEPFGLARMVKAHKDVQDRRIVPVIRGISAVSLVSASRAGLRA
jgi:hypothetical protein